MQVSLNYKSWIAGHGAFQILSNRSSDAYEAAFLFLIGLFENSG
jgi:hypothetical protein